MSEKVEFTETRLYPIIFMIIITIFFVGILATFYHNSKERIKRNEVIAFQTKVLNLFDLPAIDVEKSFRENLKEIKKDDLAYYIASKNEEVIGNVFVISGPGLWGTINAIVAVTPDLKNIIKFDILDQNETPGLGGRITEDGFLSQFTNKILVDNNKVIDYKLISEEDKPKEKEISQITGATFSSKSVTKMINVELKKISKTLGFSYE